MLLFLPCQQCSMRKGSSARTSPAFHATFRSPGVAASGGQGTGPLFTHSLRSDSSVISWLPAPSLKPVAYGTYLYQSIDRHFRTIEESHGLWPNLSIEFETERVARPGATNHVDNNWRLAWQTKKQPSSREPHKVSEQLLSEPFSIAI